MYLLLFLVGLIGFTAMTALGFLSHGGGHDHGGHGHTPVGNGHGGHAPLGGSQGATPAGFHNAAAHHTPFHGSHSVEAMPQAPQPSMGPLGPKIGHAPHGHHGARVSVKGARRGKGLARWFAISPLDLFSFSFGAGAAGILLKEVVSGAVLPWMAVIGAFLFNFGLVKPAMGALLRFAATPSEGLEGAIARNGVAMTRFDQDGRGLVCLTLDGQSVQVLATLDRDEIQRGVQVAKGDPVTILEVDPNKNTCRVTRELAV